MNRLTTYRSVKREVIIGYCRMAYHIFRNGRVKVQLEVYFLALQMQRIFCTFVFCHELLIRMC